MSAFIETENHAIHNGTYTRLDKEELLRLPWMAKAISSAGSKLFLNNCLGYTVLDVNTGGAIATNLDLNPGPLYIARYSADKKERLYLLEMSRNEDGFVKSEPLNIVPIFKVTVSDNHYTDRDGLRMFSDGEEVWRFP
jgi:hypothetical protein